MSYSSTIFQPGNLIRINNYQFQDGLGVRNKYLIVLFRNNEEAYILHTLTTTNNQLNVSSQQYGCSVLKPGIPYFSIPIGQIIGPDNYSFDKQTFIFFKDNIRKEALENFKKYSGNLQIQLLDTFSNADLKRLIKCLLKSDFIPDNLISELEKFKSSL